MSIQTLSNVSGLDYRKERRNIIEILREMKLIKCTKSVVTEDDC